MRSRVWWWKEAGMVGKKKPDPTAIVRGLSRGELESLVLERLARGDTALEGAILLQYGEADRGSARNLVHRLVEGHADDYHGCLIDTEGLADELDALRVKAAALRGGGTQTRAFEMPRAIAEESGPRCWQGDDHDGAFVDIVRETIGDILALASRRESDADCRA